MRLCSYSLELFNKWLLPLSIQSSHGTVISLDTPWECMSNTTTNGCIFGPWTRLLVTTYLLRRIGFHSRHASGICDRQCGTGTHLFLSTSIYSSYCHSSIDGILPYQYTASSNKTLYALLGECWATAIRIPIHHLSRYSKPRLHRWKMSGRYDTYYFWQQEFVVRSFLFSSNSQLKRQTANFLLILTPC